MSHDEPTIQLLEPDPPSVAFTQFVEAILRDIAATVAIPPGCLGLPEANPQSTFPASVP